MERLFIVFLKGAWIGGTLTVPGVSGGSMAMILGIYERLLYSVNVLFRRDENKKECFRFLILFSLGALSGIFVLSGVVVWLLHLFPVPMVFFFSGTIAGGLPVIFYELKRTVFRWYHIFFFIAGTALVVLLSMIPQGIFTVSETGIFWQLLGGLIAAIALVLPGISVSHMLYLLGIYKSLMTAISAFNVFALLPFVVGTAAGIFLTAKAVEFLLKRYKVSTYLMISGFVVGSVFELFSGVPFAELSWECFLLFFIGFIGIFTLLKKSRAGA